MVELLQIFVAMIAREIRLTVGQGQAWLGLASFFCLAALLFPFGIGPEPQILARIASGIIWVMVLLACSLSWERLFLDDYQDGFLDQLILSPHPLSLLVLARIMAQASINLAILLVLVPVVAVFLGMPLRVLPLLELSLILGLPSLSLFGALGSSLTLGARGGSGIIALIIVPLVLPVLIFAVSAIEASLTEVSPVPHLYLLTAVLVAATAILPFAVSFCLKQSLE
ncbi:MAG: heme exporter protein CcmB [Alphaproteobacteria bacterium]|nr:heme exporter protein CcmB [Alphaproteobacteria bacterium]